MTTVLMIAGTGEGPPLAAGLAARGLRVIATVTTDAGRRMFARCRASVEARVIRFDDDTLAGTLAAEGVGCVLNTAHPFAVEIAERVMRVCAKAGVPVIRFERPAVAVQGAARVYNDFPTLAADPFLIGRRVLLALGFRPLRLFAGLHERTYMVARVMPTMESLRAAERAGFSPDRIVAIRPPVGIDLERALIRRFAIDTLAAKESGSPGGQDVKQALAGEPGGPVLLLVRRPAINYSAVFSEPVAAIEACVAALAGRSSDGHNQ